MPQVCSGTSSRVRAKRSMRPASAAGGPCSPQRAAQPARTRASARYSASLRWSVAAPWIQLSPRSQVRTGSWGASGSRVRVKASSVEAATSACGKAARTCANSSRSLAGSCGPWLSPVWANTNPSEPPGALPGVARSPEVVWYITRISASRSRQRKSGGTCGKEEAGLTPMCSSLTPARASGPTRPRVCPVTSVIFAATVVRPNARSRPREIANASSSRAWFSSSLWVVNGRACQAMSPAWIASSIARRAAASPRSR